jgi:alpha-amylase/alpha-mannosidase (GH57 family)
VRLHGTKDYLDLVLLLERYPKLHQTVNLVPSLILQIEDYVAGTAIDPYLAASLTPEEELSEEQKRFIIEHFFDANHHTLIDPHPRYGELYHQRQEKGKIGVGKIGICQITAICWLGIIWRGLIPCFGMIQTLKVG